jgi:putative membrane protein
VIARVDRTTLVLSILASPETFLVVGIGVLFAGASMFTGQWFGASAVVPALAGLALVQFRRFSGNYNFTVSETPAGLQVRRGLFDLNSQTIALPRLQGIVISEPAFWRSFGWARLDVSIAGYETSSDDGNGPSASVVLPVGDRALVMSLARHVLGDADPADIELSPPPKAARWVSPVARRFMGAGAGDRLVVTREGWLTRRTNVVPHARIQSLRLVQGPLQRRLGLADLEIDSPPGPVRARARHRPAAEARRALEIEAEVSRSARQALDAAAR